jgi:hypothetical protein
MYNHPPYRNTGITSNKRIVFRDHQELREAFHDRGKGSFAPGMLDFMQRGRNAMFRLVVEGTPGDTAEAGAPSAWARTAGSSATSRS